MLVSFLARNLCIFLFNKPAIIHYCFWVRNDSCSVSISVAMCGRASCLELTGQNHGQNTLQKSLQDPGKERNPGSQKNATRKEQDTSALWRCAFITLEKLCWGSLQWYKDDWKLPQTGSRRFGLFSCDEDWHSSRRNRFIPSASPSGSEERQRTRMPCTTLGSMIYRRPI